MNNGGAVVVGRCIENGISCSGTVVVAMEIGGHLRVFSCRVCRVVSEVEAVCCSRVRHEAGIPGGEVLVRNVGSAKFSTSEVCVRVCR